MFLGLGPGRDRDQNFGTCWSQLQMAFKFFFILEVILSLLYYFMGNILMYFPNRVLYTVEQLQLWRIFSSFLLPAAGSFAVINVLFDFYLLYMCMPDVEKKCSTAYVLLEVLLQIITTNLALIILGYPFIYFGVFQEKYVVGYGMQSILFYFLWSKVAQNPDEPTRFCWFPCLIPMKYIPLCLLVLLMVFGGSPITLIIYFLLGCYQNMFRKKAIIRLPLSVYRKVDSLMPTSVKQKIGYIKVASVEANLTNVCLNRGCCEWGNAEESNPLQNEQNLNQGSSSQSGNKDRVEVIGGGVQIGGVQIGGSGYRNPKKEENFKNHWQKKDQQQLGSDVIKNQTNENNIQNLETDQVFGQYEGDSENKVGDMLKNTKNIEMENRSQTSEVGLRLEQTEQQEKNDEK